MTEIKKDAYLLNVSDVLKQYDSTREGLADTDAAKRLLQQGPNTLKAIKKDSFLVRYFRQFKDLMIILLLASASISFYLDDTRTGVILVILVLFNTLLGFMQEFKAEKLMDSLEKLVRAEAKVYRDGNLKTIASSELVVGDVIYIEEGDSVPADVRLLSESELSTNDFALTGESNPSRKFTHTISAPLELARRHNLVFMGTTVATGHGDGVVIATGMNTELGRIASLSQSTQNEISPLQREINHIAKRITQGTILLCIPMFYVALHYKVGGDDSLKTAFLYAIGIASSLIPQGLPAEINTSLAQAANKLVKAKALVKKLSAVESLGATSVICTDKTGTLTKNEMTVQQLTFGHHPFWVTGLGYEPKGSVVTDKGAKIDHKTLSATDLFFVTCVFASNAKVSGPDDEHAVWHVIGDPTEGALLTLAAKAGIDPAIIDKAHPEIREHSFDSARKRMSSIRHYNGKILVFVKGAPESVLERSTHILDGGKTRLLTKKDREHILARNEMLAMAAMRNLALAYRELPKGLNEKNNDIDDVETGLVYLGMASMIDPPREEVPAAIHAAKEAHIPINIITGDNALTAKAIAQKAGLGSAASISMILGQDLVAMSDKEIAGYVKQGNTIFSRVAPEDKLRIVELAKKEGLIVAVTGDGINDAPALKRADIGVAMGITGTDVAKQSAEIVLLDDSFNTLVGAVQQGRVIFQNIKKGALSCFSSNTAELVVNLWSLAGAVWFHVPLAIGVMQILAIDLIAELFPIAALGSDGAEQDVMSDYPRNPKEHILNRSAIIDLLLVGLLIGGLAFVNFLFVFKRAGVDPSGVNTSSDLYMRATTMTYVTIVLCQLGNILQRRSPKGLFTRFQFTNKRLWIAMAFSMICVLNISYNPYVAPYFKSAPLQAIDWGYAVLAMVVFLAIRELRTRMSKVVTIHEGDSF